MKRKRIIFGIQGGKGSFNEQAILDYIERHSIKNYHVKYLYTSGKVLNHLDKGDIDFGLFAIHNSIGGIVGESIEAMSRHIFQVLEEFSIPIRHFLMKRKDVEIKEITMITAHPQVLKQCVQTLLKKYPTLKQQSGKGDLVDTAAAARAISLGKLSKVSAILGPRPLAEMYDFEIIDEDLQDDKTNKTAFLLVKK